MIKVNLSRSVRLLRLFALEENVFFFKFTGDFTYTDSMGVVWNWEGIESVAPAIERIRYGEVPLFKLTSLADCKATENSWYYSAPNLYIHWPDSRHDSSVSRALGVISFLGDVDLADGFDVNTLNYEGDIFYSPAIESISPVNITLDPLKFGMIQSFQSQITINNSSGTYYGLNKKIVNGSTVKITDNDKVIFTGITSGAEIGESSATITAIEERFFRNPTICQRRFTIAAYANILDDLVDSPIPISIGKVSGIKVIPVNTKNLVKTSSQTVRFLVSDPGLTGNTLNGAMTLYDSDGKSITVSTQDDAGCWLEWTRPANSELDLNNFTCTGQVGFLTSGLDIIKYAYETIAEYPFIDGLYDTGKWEVVNLENQEDIGIYASGTEDLVSKIIEPICSSLQVMILTKPTGELTAIQRDELAQSKFYLESAQMENIKEVIDVRSFVPEIILNYSTDGKLFVTDDTYKAIIIEEYGNIGKGEINPVQTVLYNKTDAESLASSLMELSKEPQRILSFTTPYNPDNVGLRELLPYDIIDADIYKLEVYGIEKDVYSQRALITGRIIE